MSPAAGALFVDLVQPGMTEDDLQALAAEVVELDAIGDPE